MRARMVEEICSLLEGATSFSRNALASALRTEDDVLFGLALHEALEHFRDHKSVVFVPSGRGDGVYSRATEAQKMARARRTMLAGDRKHERVTRVLGAVDKSKLEGNDLQRLQRLQEKAIERSSNARLLAALEREHD